MTKLEAVREILATFPEILNWYVTEHNVNPDQFTNRSVRTYGNGAAGIADGEIADMIIAEPEAATISASVE